MGAAAAVIVPLQILTGIVLLSSYSSGQDIPAGFVTSRVPQADANARLGATAITARGRTPLRARTRGRCDRRRRQGRCAGWRSRARADDAPARPRPSRGQQPPAHPLLDEPDELAHPRPRPSPRPAVRCALATRESQRPSDVTRTNPDRSRATPPGTVSPYPSADAQREAPIDERGADTRSPLGFEFPRRPAPDRSPAQPSPSAPAPHVDRLSALYIRTFRARTSGRRNSVRMRCAKRGHIRLSQNSPPSAAAAGRGPRAVAMPALKSVQGSVRAVARRALRPLRSRW
jgi:hypothetical protein